MSWLIDVATTAMVAVRREIDNVKTAVRNYGQDWRWSAEFARQRLREEEGVRKGLQEKYEAQSRALRARSQEIERLEDALHRYVYERDLEPHSERHALYEAQRDLIYDLQAPLPEFSAALEPVSGLPEPYRAVRISSAEVAYVRYEHGDQLRLACENEAFREAYKQVFYRDVVPKLWEHVEHCLDGGFK